VAGHPYDPVFPVDDDRHAITCSAGHFSIDQKVLKLPLSAEPERAETVARTTASNRERVRPDTGGDDRHCTIARGCTNRLDSRSDSQFGRDNTARFGYSHFAGHRQWIAKGDCWSGSGMSGGSLC
jgi:hypothetical protein